MTPRTPPSTLAAALLGLAVLLPRSAGAAGALELVGAPTSPNGLTSRTLGRGSETTYFNPALMTRASPLLEIGWFTLRTAGSIELDERPPGIDVPEEVYNAQLVGADGAARRLTLRPLPTASLPRTRSDTELTETRSFAVVGVVRPLFGGDVSFGFLGVLPLSGFLDERGFFADEREQYFSNRLDFERLGDRSGVASFTLALGARVNRWLSVGAGVDLGFATRTSFDLYVPDAADQSTVLLNPRLEATTSAAPLLGIALRPSADLTTTATLHAPVGVEMEGENRIRFWNYSYPDNEDHVLQRYTFTQAVTPLRVGFGGAYAHGTRPSGARRWEVAAEVVIERWSEYRDRHGERPADRWSDTLRPTIGGNLDTDRGQFGLDLGYVPSPVPDQVGRSNYVDNARAVTSLSWELPIHVLGTAVGVGLYLHGQWLVPRSVEKRDDAAYPVTDEFPDDARNFMTGEPIASAEGLQTNNPGYPGYSSRGHLLGAGFSVRLPQ